MKAQIVYPKFKRMGWPKKTVVHLMICPEPGDRDATGPQCFEGYGFGIGETKAEALRSALNTLRAKVKLLEDAARAEGLDD